MVHFHPGEPIPTEPGDTNRHERTDKYDERRARRADRLFYHSLNMTPDEDVDVRVTKTGMGWKEIAAIGVAMAGVGGSTAYFVNQNNQPPAFPPPVVSPVSPPLSGKDFDVLFYDKDGNLIPVPRKPEGSE